MVNASRTLSPRLAASARTKSRPTNTLSSNWPALDSTQRVATNAQHCRKHSRSSSTTALRYAVSTWCRLQCVPLGTVVESPGSDESEACSLSIIQNFQHLLLQSRICSSCHEVIAIAAGEKKRRSIQLKASPVRGKLDKTRRWCWAVHSEI